MSSWENHCGLVVELLLLEAGIWGTGTVRDLRGKRTSAVESRYQVTVNGNVTVDTSVCVCVCNSDLCSVVTNCLTAQQMESQIQNRSTITLKLCQCEQNVTNQSRARETQVDAYIRDSHQLYSKNYIFEFKGTEHV